MSRLKANIHPLLTEEVLHTLHSKQISTVLDFIKTDVQNIIKIARLNFREVLAIKNFLLKKFAATPTNGFDYYKATLTNTAIIPTGIKGIDNLLEGGFLTGNIYEICGLPASGKTHFILTVTKNVIENMQQQVYIFDTKNDFSGKKLNSMLNGNDDELRQEEKLRKVVVQRIYSRHDLINSLYSIKANLENKLRLRLIIIDSLPPLLLNSSDVTMNNSFLNHLANTIRFISIKHHITFLITNLITSWNSGDFKNQQVNAENLSCGKYWFSVPNTRLKIEKMEDKRTCNVSVVNSDTLGNRITSSEEIQLTSEGFL